MRTACIWILYLILRCFMVTSRPVHNQHNTNIEGLAHDYNYNAQNIAKPEDTQPHDEQVISVRITSSIAVGRGKSLQRFNTSNVQKHLKEPVLMTTVTVVTESTTISNFHTSTEPIIAETPFDLSGANIEFIKQLNAKKEARGVHNIEQVHPFQLTVKNQYINETDDSIAEPSIKSVSEIIDEDDRNEENLENVPLARSIPLSSSTNYVQSLTHKPPSERENHPKLTTVSFNVMHDTPKISTNYNEPSNTYLNSPRDNTGDMPKFYSAPSKIYSQPAQIYGEPAKFYSEPAKIYSEPAKIYSEPAKVYSEPAQIYSEPAKFYSEPAALYLTPNVPSSHPPWQQQSRLVGSTIVSTTPITTVINPSVIPKTQQISDQQPEKNYEVDEKISVQSDGKSHGVQESSTENCKHDNCKVGYVVEGRQFRKYRVEERTPDGFIVGEYGVVRNEDGALRGVRYTADSDASPRLIYDALMKFLQLR